MKLEAAFVRSAAGAADFPRDGLPELALVGYLIVSRYVDAWHVMNVATDPDHRGRGIATMLLERLFELTSDDARRGYTLEVRVSNATAVRPMPHSARVSSGSAARCR